ncbi:hypothetical protein [Actinoplanes sp. NPDC051851]|uniref:WXG100 family type VII secretion target n=1 Tax=Actinoplanes sp. NPDC051851 TaxID=3154753 RepID=UPI00343AD9B2
MADPTATAWTGIWIAEDIDLIRTGVENGSWIDGSLGVAGAALDGLAMTFDPLGTLLQCGAAWMIEHVRPLTEALDWLAGDPPAIAGHAQTWRDVATGLHTRADDLAYAVRMDLSEWTGAAAAAYRTRSTEQQEALTALAKASETMAAITEGASMLIAAVRVLIRDAIATVVSRLIVYAAEELATWGAATPLVVQQVTTLIATWSARIAHWLRKLLSSLRNLLPITHRLTTHIDEIKQVLNRLHHQEPALNRVRGRGAGPIQLYNMESVRSIAAKYGIDIAGLRIQLGPKNIRGWHGKTKPDGSIVLFVTGFRSEEDLARTLVHEKFHHDELAAGRPYPDLDATKAYEDRAYAHEDRWWNNQPIRPEPRTR